MTQTRPTPSTAFDWLLRMTFLATLMAAVLLWYAFNNDVFAYFVYEAPAGQIPYVLSKLSALMALVCFSFQMVVGFLKRRPTPAQQTTHIVLATVCLFFMMLHGALFIAATTLRSGSPTLHLLVPNFSDFYHSMISIGAISFWGFLLVALSGLLRARKPSWFSKLHLLSYPLFLGGCVHGIAIGTELRSVKGMLLYGGVLLVLVIIAVMVLLRTPPIRSRSLQ